MVGLNSPEERNPSVELPLREAAGNETLAMTGMLSHLPAKNIIAVARPCRKRMQVAENPAPGKTQKDFLVT